VISYLKALIGLIEYLYHKIIHSFPEAQLKRTPRLSVLDLKQFQGGWPTRKSSRVHTSEDKSVQKGLGLVCGANL
jgi:hypothetical protein